MSITMLCVECKAKSQDGVFEHTPACSGNFYNTQLIQHEIRPPAIEIKFDTEAERKKFMKKLRTGSGASL